MIRDDRVYLSHIIDALQQIREYTANLDSDDFSSSRIVQDAVIRQFEIVGEATKNISEGFRTMHSGIPWKDLAGFREKLIHQYFGVDISLVWRSVVEDVPQLLEELDGISTSQDKT